MIIHKEGRENLLKEAERMAAKCRRFVEKNQGNPETSLDFAKLTAELRGFLRALFFAGIINEGEMRATIKYALPTFSDRSEPLPPVFAKLIASLGEIDKLGEGR